MAKVYRVECKESGIGPYNGFDEILCDEKAVSLCSGHDCSPEHPTGSVDFSEKRQLEGQFGFSSKAKLKRWFEPCWRRAMHELGLHVAVFNTDSANSGWSGRQLVFDRESSTLLSTISLLEI